MAPDMRTEMRDEIRSDAGADATHPTVPARSFGGMTPSEAAQKRWQRVREERVARSGLRKLRLKVTSPRSTTRPTQTQ